MPLVHKADPKSKAVELADSSELTRVPSVSPAFGFCFKCGKHEYSFYASSATECSEWMKALVGQGTKPSRVLGETTLNLSGTSLDKFPKTALVKQGLSSINLSSNSLTKLPEDFGSFGKLETLDLSSNQLKSLPDAFGYLFSLKSLNLHENALTTLPPSFGRLVNLVTLTLSSNKFTDVPAEIANLVTLETFVFSYNTIASGQFKPDLAKLTALRFIDLSGCGLTSLPASIGSIESIRVIEAFKNQLTDIPDSFGRLTKLQRLNISRNKIPLFTVPLSASIEELDISQNPITDLPKYLGSRPQLFIEYTQCPLTSIPAENRTPLSALKAYLSTKAE